tara:strand:+ start:3932 stop:5053 length:1122 start_codon:yes stop_codon:yes gene_type:complete
MIKNIFIIIILLFSNKNIFTQDPVFSKFLFNPIYLNPALAGMDNNYRISVNQRNQWSKIPSQFNTNSISFDSWQNNSNTALSILYSNSNEGEAYLKTNNFSVGGAYRLFDVFPSPFAWQFGFQYQYTRKNLDFSKLVFSDELDHYLGNINSSSFITPNINSFNSSNLALGTVLTYHIKRGSRSRRFNIPIDLDVEMGFAVHNFLQRSNSFINSTNKINRKYTLHGSMLWPFKSGDLLGGVKHSAMYLEQGGLSTLQLGLAEAWLYPLHFGVFYRQQMSTLLNDLDRYESIYFVFSYQKVYEQSNLSLTFSYSRDFTISELGSYTNGINEFSIIVESIEGGLFAGLIQSKRYKKKKNRSIPCYSKFNTRAGLIN